MQSGHCCLAVPVHHCEPQGMKRKAICHSSEKILTDRAQQSRRQQRRIGLVKGHDRERDFLFHAGLCVTNQTVHPKVDHFYFQLILS